MGFFQARADLRHIETLLATFERIVAFEATARQNFRNEGAQFLGPHQMFRRIREEAATRHPEYAPLRQSYARMIPGANLISERTGILWHRQGRAAPLEGRAPFQGSVFELILNRPSDLADLDTDLRDTANQVIGVLEQRLREERRRLFNPFYWIAKAATLIVRLPYNLLKISGFDVDKMQEHFIARLFQLLYVIALILIAFRLGVTSLADLASFLSAVIGK